MGTPWWPAAGTAVASGRDARRARDLLWAATGLVVFDVVVGGGWDGQYHQTQPFDGFFSPPHLFIYALAAVVLGIVAWLTRDPALRACLGPTVRVPVLGVALPGALLLLDAGCAGLALAGPADAVWHTLFGLDETQWSLPHAMLGTSLGMITIGATSCRLALRHWLPLWPLTPYLLGFLLAWVLGPFLGPLGANATAEAARVAGGLGVLGADADYAHLVRMVVAADLTHTNPAFPLAAGLWCGLILGVLRAMDPRPAFWVVVAVLVGLALDGAARDEAVRLGLGADPAVTTGLPLLTALAGFGLAARLPISARLAAAGGALGLHAALVWGGTRPVAYAVAAAVTPLTTVAGGRAGAWLWRLVVEPGRPAAWRFALGWVVGLPVLTGAVDLAVRLTVP